MEQGSDASVVRSPNGLALASLVLGGSTIFILAPLVFVAYAFRGEGGGNPIEAVVVVLAFCLIPVLIFALAWFGYSRNWPSALIVILNVVAFILALMIWQ